MKGLFILSFFIYCVSISNAQIVTSAPAFPAETDSVTITFDATKGTAGLANCNCDVYIHTGVITNLSSGGNDWKHVFTTWGQPNIAWRMTALGNNLFSYKLSPSLRAAYGVTGTETIQKLAMVFRNGDGSKEGKDNGGTDIFLNVYPANTFNVSFIAPSKGIIKNINDSVTVIAAASRKGPMTMYENGIMVATLPNDSVISYTTTAVTAGNRKMVVAATFSGNTKYDTLTYVVFGGTPIANLPSGVKPGINYNGPTSVTLCLIAPYKNFIYVIGDFTNWNPDAATLMNHTPDNKYFWVTINGLQANIEYAYQFYIDGSLKVADSYCEKILDPNNDKYIPASVYPNIKDYPAGKATGLVSVFQTGQAPFNWQYSTGFNKPFRENLNVYELLVRDFHQNHNFKAVMDSLDYLKRMGINAIELMPFNEFEGNESWGYNPDFYFAVDKAYGTKNDLKALIDKCHQNGIAVIMDMVLNHSFGQSPMVQMYFNTSTGQPGSQSPWFNAVATHPFSVGYDFNHESGYTKDFVDTVLSYWVNEFKLDGFRFDLSKGFTQVNSGTNVSLWGQYDQSRINIWQRIYDKVKVYAPSTYMILEHFSDNSEEKELALRGFMLWGKMTDQYNQNTLGYASNADLSWGSYKARTFTDNNLMQYMESHDEERLMYKNLQFGNNNGGYNIKNLNTALKRNAAAIALFYSQPGPKMIWQFGELGYDYSINRCTDGTINNNCRLDSKPVRWDFLLDSNRYKLYKIFGAMQLLHNNAEFRTSNYEWYTTTVVKNAKMNGANLKVNTIVNFDMSSQTGTPDFQQSGWWYDYLSGDSFNVTNTAMTMMMQPGEYHVYTTPKVALPSWIKDGPGRISGLSNSVHYTHEFQIAPNPARNELDISGYYEEGPYSSYKIQNVLGQTLLHGQVTAKQTAIDISTLAPGIYFVSYGDEVKRFVKE